MKSLRRIAIWLGLMLIVLAAGCAAPAPGKPGEAKRLLMGSFTMGSSHYLYAVAAAKVINKNVPGLEVTVSETGGTVENVDRMAKGDFHMGTFGPTTGYQFLKALAPYEARPRPDLRTLWIYTVAGRIWVVREDSGIKSLSELDGKDFGPGPRGSATEAEALQIHEALGIKPKLYRGGGEELSAATKDRRIVGYGHSVSWLRLDAPMLDLRTFTPIRILSFSPEEVKKVKEKYPYFPFVTSKPGQYYAGAPEITTLVSYVGVATMKDLLTEEEAYRITKAMHQDKVEQVTVLPDLKDYDIAKWTLESLGLYDYWPIHKGAIKYYREIGLQVADKHIPPEAK